MNHASGERLSYDDLSQYEPIDWPDRQLVEQDNMGDWGAWLSQFDGWLQDVLQIAREDVTPLARAIAEEYITECCAAGYPMPADFAQTGAVDAARAADEAGITHEYAEYLRIWQLAVAAKLK